MGDRKTRVLVAGIGGASLGTEIMKSLKLAGGYEIFGCDVSPLAYGHFEAFAAQTFVIDRDDYTSEILSLCREHGIQAVLPGGEQPMILLGTVSHRLQEAGAPLIGNRPEVIDLCTDKGGLFDRLKELNIQVPWTATVAPDDPVTEPDSYPCIVKPSSASGGSVLTAIVTNAYELRSAAYAIHRWSGPAMVQEYVDARGGEFTIGVLSDPDSNVLGSVAMQRIFHSKLSVKERSAAGLVSSGYSQGLIDDFPDVRKQAENIAVGVGSAGPINVQGRVRDGVLVPFELNPRFSASTYLRALAGFNEIDIYLKLALYGESPPEWTIARGHYLRSFTEKYVPAEEVKRS